MKTSVINCLLSSVYVYFIQISNGYILSRRQANSVISSRPQKQHRFLSFEKFYQTSLETQCYEDRNCSFEEFSERAEDEGFDQARTETKGEQLLNTVPYNTRVDHSTFNKVGYRRRFSNGFELVCYWYRYLNYSAFMYF